MMWLRGLYFKDSRIDSGLTSYLTACHGRIYFGEMPMLHNKISGRCIDVHLP